MADWNEVLAAVGTALGGDKAEGIRVLSASWGSTGEGDHAQRCVLAHYLADVQDELDAEIAWDETALHEHGFLEDADLSPVGIASVRGMLPSLHLNLGDGYLRRRQVELAAEHWEAGTSCCPELPDDGYGAMIRAGLHNLRQRISAAGE
ncbi:hypothetical protein ACIQXM_13685 [Arthrobacter sp. NPDC097144]|uniref:hypothetical protein n=1 Tax=Arthrobacter sp. NPDC097144 TaxID=3363946 RepID=UPI0037FAEF01